MRISTIKAAYSYPFHISGVINLFSNLFAIIPHHLGREYMYAKSAVRICIRTFDFCACGRARTNYSKLFCSLDLKDIIVSSKGE